MVWFNQSKLLKPTMLFINSVLDPICKHFDILNPLTCFTTLANVYMLIINCIQEAGKISKSTSIMLLVSCLGDYTNAIPIHQMRHKG